MNSTAEKKLSPVVVSAYEELVGSVDSLDELNEIARECPEEMRVIVDARYTTLISSVDSLDELEKRITECPEVIADRYFFLIRSVDSLDELESRIQNSPVFDDDDGYDIGPVAERYDRESARHSLYKQFLESAIVNRYVTLIDSVGSLDELERRLRVYSDGSNDIYERSEIVWPIIVNRYATLIDSVGSLDELEIRIVKCPERAMSIVVERYKKLFPSWLASKPSPEDVHGRFKFCPAELKDLFYE